MQGVDLLETLSKKRWDANVFFGRGDKKPTGYSQKIGPNGSSLIDHGYPDITLNGENKINFAH